MNKQVIYITLSTVLTVIIAMGANAQTNEDKEPKGIRETLFKDGIGIKTAKAQTLGVNAGRELSATSPQKLRELIFENYTAPGSKGMASRSTAAPQGARSAGTVKLPSESVVEEATEAKQGAKPVQTPPTQGNTKEDQ